jgi:hypothetical protein
MFNLFYRYLYGIGIRRNRYVIVQQEWLRDEFKRLFSVQNVIVAHPVVSSQQNKIPKEKNSGENFIFFIPLCPGCSRI